MYGGKKKHKRRKAFFIFLNLFSNVKKEGILLYDSKNFKLVRRRKLNPQERARIAEDDFKYWIKSAKEFYKQYVNGFKDRFYNNAAFQLHQATEHAYTAILLVFTGYKPKTHKLTTLGKRCACHKPTFLTIFPKTTPNEERMFKLLVKAYVDARYKPSNRISKKELEYLGERVKKLHGLVKRLCKKKIEDYMAGAGSK